MGKKVGGRMMIDHPKNQAAIKKEQMRLRAPPLQGTAAMHAVCSTCILKHPPTNMQVLVHAGGTNPDKRSKLANPLPPPSATIRWVHNHSITT